MLVPGRNGRLTRQGRWSDTDDDQERVQAPSRPARAVPRPVMVCRCSSASTSFMLAALRVLHVDSSTHRRGSPGSRNNPARPGVKHPEISDYPPHSSRTRTMRRRPLVERSAFTTTSSNGSHNPRSHARCSRDFRGSKSDHGPEVGWVLSSVALRSDDQGFRHPDANDAGCEKGTNGPRRLGARWRWC